MAERLPDPAVQKSLEVDLTLIGHDGRLLTDLELSIVQTAKAHDAQPFSRLRSLPGGGKILALVLLDAIHDSQRLPRVQVFVSYGRLVQGAKASAGTRDGPSGTKIGKASLTGAFSEAAGLCFRNNPAGQKYLARLERRHGTGKALPVRAHKVARAVYYLVTRDLAVDLDQCLHEERRGAGEPTASLDAKGISRARRCWERENAASWTAQGHIGLVSPSPAC